MSKNSNYQGLLPFVEDFNAGIDGTTRNSVNVQIPKFWYFNRSDLEQLSNEVPPYSANQGYTLFDGIRLYSAMGLNQDDLNITHVTFVMSPMYNNGSPNFQSKCDVTGTLFEFARTCPPLCREKKSITPEQDEETSDSYYAGTLNIPRAFQVDLNSVLNLVLSNPAVSHLVIERQIGSDQNGGAFLGLKLYGGIANLPNFEDIEIIEPGITLENIHENHVDLGADELEDFPERGTN